MLIEAACDYPSTWSAIQAITPKMIKEKPKKSLVSFQAEDELQNVVASS